MVNLDPAAALLARNRAHPRKRLLYADLADDRVAIGGPYDLICCNWALHHLIAGDERATRRAQGTALTRMRQLLTSGGCLLIFEDRAEGLFASDVPGHLAYALMRHRLLAPLAHRLGGRTAGVGVRLRSQRSWHDLFERRGCRVAAHVALDWWTTHRLHQLALSAVVFGNVAWLLRPVNRATLRVDTRLSS